jgi:xanthine dehydrogenase YagS FAD-binding subunit
MRPFGYHRPLSVTTALEAGGAPGTRYLAGGTNLVDLMKLGVEAPERLVDISRLELGEIREQPGGGLWIGATARNADLATDPRVRERYPMLAQALLAGASAQVRNIATVGGNLLQRTRCAYFQDVSKPCNKRRPGSGCPAREGEHSGLAILGHSPACVATHPSDMAVALAALDARVQLAGTGGETRTVPIPGLHRLPGGAPERDTVLEHGELITAVELPPPAFARSAYRKVRERASFAFALVSVAAAVELTESGAVRDCRIALGGVAHAPWRARRAEEALTTGASYAEAAEAELAAAEPLRDNAYKVTLARNLIVAVLTELVR